MGRSPAWALKKARTAMPPPRCRLPGTTYAIERRTERRVHLFRPDARMNQVFLYCLGYALEKTGVRLMSVTLMSNHYHAVVHDPSGRICELTEVLNGLLTKTTQALRGWQGSVFDGAGPSYVELLTREAVVQAVGYALANPTAAGLVRYSRDWPGVRTRVSEIGGRAIIVDRPPAFFAEDGVMPERVELRAEAELLLETDETGLELDDEAKLEKVRAEIAEAVEKAEEKARAEVAAAGWSFKSADRVLASSPYSRAVTFEQRHELNPRYASAGDKEELEKAVDRDAEFVERYALCRGQWLAGKRDVIWPAGTNAMRRRHRVPCAEPPAPG